MDVKLSNVAKLMEQKEFNKQNPTVFYSHGYKETPDSESVHTIVSAYLQAQPNTNMILIDWSNMAFGTYHINAAPNTKLVRFSINYVLYFWKHTVLSFVSSQICLYYDE